MAMAASVWRIDQLEIAGLPARKPAQLVLGDATGPCILKICLLLLAFESPQVGIPLISLPPGMALQQERDLTNCEPRRLERSANPSPMLDLLSAGARHQQARFTSGVENLGANTNGVRSHAKAW